LKSPREVWQLRRKLRAMKFDVSVDPQGLTKSSIIGWLSGARMRIGFKGEDGREISPWLNNYLVRHTADHVVDRYLELLQPLGITEPNVRFNLPHWPNAQSTIVQWLEKERIVPPYAI